MSKVHIGAARDGLYRMVIHTTIPVGNNSANESWVNCVLEDRKDELGVVSSALTTGTGTYQITAAELASLQAGTIIEYEASVHAESGGASAVSIDAIADSVIAQEQGRLQARYKYYGHTQD